MVGFDREIHWDKVKRKFWGRRDGEEGGESRHWMQLFRGRAQRWTTG